MSGYRIFVRVVDEQFFLGMVYTTSESAALSRAEQLYSNRKAGHLLAKRSNRTWI